MIDYLFSKIKEHPEVSVGGLIGGIAIYGSAAWPEFTNPLGFICIGTVYLMLSRSARIDHTFKSLARAIPVSVVMAFVVIAAAFSVGNLFADPIQSGGRQAIYLILMISIIGSLTVIPAFLTRVFINEVAKSPKGQWLEWRIRTEKHKMFIADIAVIVFLISFAIDVSLHSAANVV